MQKIKFKIKASSKIRMYALSDSPLHTKVKGSKKGKRGYSRKDKSWRNYGIA